MLGADNPQTLLWLALACASCSWTLTKTPAFDWVRGLVRKEGPLGQLWECPYCMAHWISLLLVALVRPRPFTGEWYDLPVAAFAVVTLAALLIQVLAAGGELLKLLRMRMILMAQGK